MNFAALLTRAPCHPDGIHFRHFETIFVERTIAVTVAVAVCTEGGKP
jgi:hypothetical protein